MNLTEKFIATIAKKGNGIGWSGTDDFIDMFKIADVSGNSATEKNFDRVNFEKLRIGINEEG